jgi:hypothetical protein
MIHNAGAAADSDHREVVKSSNGKEVSFYFKNIPSCLPVFLLRQ